MYFSENRKDLNMRKFNIFESFTKQTSWTSLRFFLGKGGIVAGGACVCCGESRGVPEDGRRFLIIFVDNDFRCVCEVNLDLEEVIIFNIVESIASGLRCLYIFKLEYSVNGLLLEDNDLMI